MKNMEKTLIICTIYIVILFLNHLGALTSGDKLLHNLSPQFSYIFSLDIEYKEQYFMKDTAIYTVAYLKILLLLVTFGVFTTTLGKYFKETITIEKG